MKAINIIIGAAVIACALFLSATWASAYTSLPGNLKGMGPNITEISQLYRGNLQMFRVFLPPGARDITIYGHCGQDASVRTFNVLIGAPPARGGTPTTTQPFTVSQIASTQTGKNSSGYVRIVKDAGIIVTSGKWIYVMITGTITDMYVRIGLDNAIYRAWYATAAWDSNGDPTGGTAPAPAPTPVPTVTPIPIPTTTPTPTPSTETIFISPSKTYRFVVVP